VKSIWIRRLIPAGVVSVVLAFSYFAPVLGMNGPPVNDPGHPNCGRFGYGYHGGKHMFPCPTHPPHPANPNTEAAAARNTAPANASGPSTTRPMPAAPPSKSIAVQPVVGAPVSAGVTQWRSFTGLVLRELD